MTDVMLTHVASVARQVGIRMVSWAFENGCPMISLNFEIGQNLL